MIVVNKRVIKKFSYLKRGTGRNILPIAAFTLLSPSLWAFEFDTGNSDVSIHWDNTIKYSNAFRLKDQSSKLLADPNGDDGDRNFDQGLISNRLDLLSEFDFTYRRDFGARVSGAGWYDQVYNQSTDNNSPTTSNQPLGDSKKFPTATEKLHGRKAELLDAFVFGRGTIGDTRWSFRAGQYAQQWGETLFFGANGIAGGQAPIDVIKALSVPGTQFKELIRPTEQFSVSLQPNQDLLFSAYVQTEWEASRLPGAGSYFGADILDKGGDRLLVGVPPFAPNALYFQRGGDMQAKDSGQWGVQMRFRLPNGLTDYGLYAIRYHDKTPNLYLRPGVGASGDIVGSYQLAYQEGVRAYGFSANHTFGTLNLAAEISARRNTALVNDGVALAPTVIPSNDRPLYPVGNSLHANLSAFWSLSPSDLFKEASFLGEIAWNRRASITKNAEFIAANATRDAAAIRFVFTPTYRPLPELSLDVPFGVGWAPRGTSSVVSGFGVNHGGDISLGVNATYLAVWKGSVNLTHYYGPEGTASQADFKQTLKDRDFIAFSLSRAF